MGLATNISRVGQFARQGDEFLGSTGLKAHPVGAMAGKALRLASRIAPKLSFLVSKKDEIVKEGKGLVKAYKEKDIAGGLSAVEGLARIGKEAVGTKEYKKSKGGAKPEVKPLPEAPAASQAAVGDTFFAF
jgi:hypothetical protein